MVADTREGAPAAAELLPAPELDLKRAVRIGAVGAIVAAFVAASGMVQTFDIRTIINPILSLSYVALFAVPFGIGYIAGQPPMTLEGYAQSVPGPRNVQAGLIGGTLTGVGLAVFMVLIDVLDFSSVFIKLTDRLSELLTFGLGLGVAAVIMIVAMAAMGAAGGAVHLLTRRWKRAILYAAVWTMLVGLLQIVILQTGLARAAVFTELLYSVSGGLTIIGAVIVYGLFFAAYFFLDRPAREIRTRVETLEPAAKRRFRLTAFAATVVVLAVLPQLLGPFLSEVLDLAGVFLLMALGLNIVVGYAGLLDLGYVAFFAVGAYATAVLTSPASPRWSPELTFWTAIPFIILAAATAGIMVGTPVLRMRGDYLAIVTLGFGEIARISFLSDALKPYFGGAQGLLLVPDIPAGPVTINDSVTFFYPIFAFVLLFAYLSYALQDSRIGRAWMAMREDEPVAEVMGVNIVAAKLWAFIIGAIFAGLGGALFAHKIGSVFPESFSIIVSITVLVLIIVGGMASVPGVTMGALVLVGLPELLREFEDFKFLFYGTLLIFMMLKRPEGFIPSRRRARELHEEEVLQDAWLQQQQAGGAAPEAAGAD